MKKLISVLLTITMLFGISTAVLAADIPQQDYPQRFWDVPKDHWAFNYIAELVNKGVLAGYEDGSFKPDSTVTRAEWAKIMVLAAGLPVNDNNVYFTDMGNHWANAYVNTAKDYLAAYTDGTFKPDQAAVREDVTVSMVKLKGYDVSNVDYSYLSQFTDVNSISNSLKAYVAVAVEKDLISGFDDGTFRGQNTLTRAEAATLLWRAFQYGNDNKVVDTPDTPITTPPTTTVTTPPTTTTPPTQTDKPQQTPDNTTPDNTVETPEPTEEPEQTKPFKVDTLVKTNVKDIYYYTYDSNNTIYYVDGSKIYSVDINTKTQNEILDVSDLTIDNDEMTLSDFSIESICYDTFRNRLAIVGHYSTVNTANKVNNLYLYTWSNGNIEKVTDNFYPTVVYHDGNTKTRTLASVSNNLLEAKISHIASNGDYYNQNYVNNIIDGTTFSASSGEVLNDVVFESNDGIYGVLPFSSKPNQVYKYNYVEREYLFAFPIEYTTVGLSQNEVVTMSANDIVIYNYKGKVLNEITKNDMEVIDKRPINFSDNNHRKLIISNNNIIFYDNTAKAFRIISENN